MFGESSLNTAMNLQVTKAIQLLNIPISSQLCYVTKETIWKNTDDFIDGRTILRWILDDELDGVSSK